MDDKGNHWYKSNMTRPVSIPVFTLFGETEQFPDVVHCERIVDRASEHGWKISAHRHTQMAQLIVAEHGTADILVDGKSFVVRDNTVIYIPVQAVHSFSFAPGTEGSVLSFPTNVLHSIGPISPTLNENLSRPFVGDLPDHLATLITALTDQLSGTGTFRTQTTIGLAHAVLSSIAELNSEYMQGGDSVHDKRLDQLDRLISDHVTDGWGARDFARAMAISVGHLSRVCRASKGVSASAYVEAAVIEEACRLLAFTQMSVAEVGYRLGYGDPSYFSRRFRAVRGQTPSTYRAGIWR
jgi:AraC family transcriptional activator of pobA